MDQCKLETTKHLVSAFESVVVFSNGLCLLKGEGFSANIRIHIYNVIRNCAGLVTW